MGGGTFYTKANLQNSDIRQAFERSYIKLWNSGDYEKDLIFTLHKYKLDLNIEVYWLENNTMPGQIDTAVNNGRGGIIIYG